MRSSGFGEKHSATFCPVFLPQLEPELSGCQMIFENPMKSELTAKTLAVPGFEPSLSCFASRHLTAELASHSPTIRKVYISFESSEGFSFREVEVHNLTKRLLTDGNEVSHKKRTSTVSFEWTFETTFQMLRALFWLAGAHCRPFSCLRTSERRRSRLGVTVDRLCICIRFWRSQTER